MDREQSLELLKQAIALAKAGQRGEARTLLLDAISKDAENEMAWLWLASVAASSEEARASLGQALVLNPTHEAAAAWLERLEEEVREETPSTGAPEVAQTQPRAEDQTLDGARESPAFPLGYLNLERLREAVSYLQAAAELQPENPRLQNLVASLQGRLEEATAKAQDAEASAALGNASVLKNVGNAARVVPGLGTASPGQVRMVLVADGDAGVRQLVARVLGGAQWEVLQASDGLRAIACLQQAVPDLILVATDLRKVDGGRICELVKSNDLTREIPVVLLGVPGGGEGRGPTTGNPKTDADLVLEKPIDARILKQVLIRFFGTAANAQL